MSVRLTATYRGFQMVYFQTKNANSGIFLKASGWKFLPYFIAIFGIFHGHHSVFFCMFTLVYYISPFRCAVLRKSWQPYYISLDSEIIFKK
jgi:hypothetical protein